MPNPRARRFFDRWGENIFVSFEKKWVRKTAFGAEKSSEKWGLLHYAIDKKHRNRAISNLHMAYPDWSEVQCKRVAKQVFVHFARVGGDFVRSSVRTKQDVLDSTEVAGFEYLEEAESLQSGVLLVSGHFGNWERYAQWMVAKGRDVHVVVRDADQKGVQARMMAIRENAGVSILSRGNAARGILGQVRKKGLVGILADQNSGDCFVPFFNKPCGTVTGPAVLHTRSGAALLPTYCARLDYNKYKVIFLPPIDLSNTMEDPVAITAQVNCALESVVRQYPEQWLWMHDRWKSARQKGLL